MQFKHPEILWALVLLAIPILIHLFQLRRFKKTPFTNVAMLQKVVSESRKSNSLKKWLLLLTRLLLLASIVIAFAQPFSAANTALQEKETVIYLDDSFSMQAKSNGLSLLRKSVQDLIKNIDAEHEFSLFTNERSYKNVTIKDIQNGLLELPYTHKQLNLGDIQLKANTFFTTSDASVKNLILISDFQQRIISTNDELAKNMNSHFVPIQPRNTQNVAIDSVYLQDNLSGQASLTVLLSGGLQDESLPISLYDKETLIAKTSAKFNPRGNAEVAFSVPSNQEILGRIQIADNSLSYDNQFFFNIQKRPTIKVLAINESDDSFLKRLYPSDEFSFRSFPLNQLDYSILAEQHLVVLNHLKSIPNSLQKALRSFKADGGTLIVIPAVESDLDSYNQFLTGFFSSKLLENLPITKKITSISFEHPLYKNVFEKEVSNFQYPSVKEYFKVQTRAPKILSFEGNEPFLSGRDGFYLFSSSLENEHSNFKNSPLIVPTFYNMAVLGLQASNIYHNLGEPNTIDIPIEVGSDNILNVSKEGYEFIPLQQAYPKKVRLLFNDNPTVDGIFSINNQSDSIQQISFNYPREESQLNYFNVESLGNISTQDSITALFESLEEENSIAAYWKWFVILALLLALIEVIIQKFIT